MMPPEPSQPTAVLESEKLVYGGSALARQEGRVLLVPFVLPGERVEVRLPSSKRAINAGLVRVLDASPHRVQPHCEYFGRCGGCHYQHSDYAFQTSQKEAILRETLARLGSIHFEQEIPIISGNPWGYRNRIQLHFEGGKAGFRRPDSHSLCPITHCPISSPKLNQVIGVLAEAVTRPQWPSFLKTLEIFTDETAVQFTVTESTKPVAARFFHWISEQIENSVPQTLSYDVGTVRYSVGRGTFFQVNRFLVEPLVQEVTGSYAGADVADLYAGAGLFTVPLSKTFQKVRAVERGVSAFRDLEKNVTAYCEAGRVETIQSTTDDYLATLDTAPDLLILDPPRAGMGQAVTDSLLRLRPERLAIVSCDPATLARDLRALADSYEIRRMSLVDLFPQTFHMETVVHLERKL